MPDMFETNDRAQEFNTIGQGSIPTSFAHYLKVVVGALGGKGSSYDPRW